MELPYVDEHDVRIDAPRSVVGDALDRYAETHLTAAAGPAFSRLLGTDPPGGFAVDRRVAGERVELVGRHHFSRYRLVFTVDDAGEGATRLSAQTYAAFPGPHGRGYRALVIGTRFHVLATKRMLADVRRWALADADALAQVLAYERALQTPQCRSDHGRMASLLSDDFTEIGASGKHWDRAAILDLVAAESAEGPADPIVVKDLAGRVVGDGLVVAQWESERGPRRARRTSLWRRESGEWRLLHHQGTLVPYEE